MSMYGFESLQKIKIFVFLSFFLNTTKINFFRSIFRYSNWEKNLMNEKIGFELPIFVNCFHPQSVLFYRWFSNDCFFLFVRIVTVQIENDIKMTILVFYLNLSPIWTCGNAWNLVSINFFTDGRREKLSFRLKKWKKKNLDCRAISLKIQTSSALKIGATSFLI